MGNLHALSNINPPLVSLLFTSLAGSEYIASGPLPGRIQQLLVSLLLPDILPLADALNRLRETLYWPGPGEV